MCYRKILVAASCTTLFITTAAEAARLTPQEPAPVIHSVATDMTNGALTIEGSHFGNSAPIVTLGTQTLRVRRFTADQVVADIPAALQQATYKVTLTKKVNGWQQQLSDVMSVVIMPK